MTSWQKTKFVLFGFLCVYFFIALATSFTKAGELFPVFNGHWFYKTPNEFNDYGLLISQLDGKDYSEPLYLEKVYSKLMVWPFAAYGAVQRWGEAAEKQMMDQDAQMKAAQKLIFGSRSFKAQLVKRKMDPLEFVLHNNIGSFQVLANVEN